MWLRRLLKSVDVGFVLLDIERCLKLVSDQEQVRLFCCNYVERCLKLVSDQEQKCVLLWWTNLQKKLLWWTKEVVFHCGVVSCDSSKQNPNRYSWTRMEVLFENDLELYLNDDRGKKFISKLTRIFNFWRVDVLVILTF